MQTPEPRHPQPRVCGAQLNQEYLDTVLLYAGILRHQGLSCPYFPFSISGFWLIHLPQWRLFKRISGISGRFFPWTSWRKKCDPNSLSDPSLLYFTLNAVLSPWIMDIQYIPGLTLFHIVWIWQRLQLTQHAIRIICEGVCGFQIW